MTPTDPYATADWRTQLAGWLAKARENLILAAITGVPMLVLNQVLNVVGERTTSQPWQVLWLLMPLMLIAYLAWRVVRRRGALRLHAPFWVFFAVYILIFSVAAGSRVLDWQRTLTGFEDTVPHNWLALNGLGDWRYWLVPRSAPADDVIVLTVAPGLPQLDGRLQLANLIQLANGAGARGIAFDFYLTDETAIDPVICAAVQSASIPVMVGYTFRRIDGDVVRLPTSSALEACLPLSTSQGHLVGYLEADHQVRALPTHFKGQADRPALSVLIANALSDGDIEVPPLLYFTVPAEPVQRVSLDRLIGDALQRERLRDRFILVGELSDNDRFVTPFGELPGVVIHAYAAHALRSGHYLERPPYWSGFALVFGLCFLIVVLAAEGVSARRLLVVAVAASLLVVAGAAMAITVWRVWLAVIYPLVAMWLLLLLLWGLRRSALFRSS